LVKTERALYESLKRNTDNEFFINLIALLDSRIKSVNDKWPREIGIENISILQGRAQELKDIRDALLRRPVATQHTGAFG
jgi:hypothetical protein